MLPSSESLARQAAQEAELARCHAEWEASQLRREEADLSWRLDDLQPLAEEAIHHLQLDLVNAGEGREPGVRRETYESVREFLRLLARVVPLPSDYAKAWKDKYPATKKGPSGEPVRQRNMGGLKVPYTEEPLRRAFGAIVQHAAAWSTLTVEEVVACCQREVQKALLEDIGVELSEWVRVLDLSKKTCDSLRILSNKCHNSSVKEVKSAHHPQPGVRGLEDENFQPTLRAGSQHPGPELRGQQLLAAIEAFVQEFPGQTQEFFAELARRIEPVRPARAERTLNLRMASEKSGLSTTYLSRLCMEGVIGEKIDKKPRFSEFELDEFTAQVRRPGPKTKVKKTP